MEQKLLIFICLIILLFFIYYCFFKTEMKNPPASYWFFRSDEGGAQFFDQDGYYLKQSIQPPIPRGKCDNSDSKCPQDNVCYNGMCIPPYTNAEIYNNPCCGYEETENACKKWISDNFCEKNKDNPICTFLDVDKLKKQLCDLHKEICKGNSSTSVCNLVPNPINIDNNPVDSLKELFFNVPYLYSDFSITIKVNNLKDGSRGWGFWNTTMSLDMAFIWFIQQDGICPPGFGELCPSGQLYGLNGFYAMIYMPSYKDGKYIPKIKTFKLDIDEDWHDYKITWKKDKIVFYMDGKDVYTETEVIPDVNMAFHCWVDNAVFAPVHVVQNMKRERSQIIKKLSIDK
jgi:hypothetical protein